MANYILLTDEAAGLYHHGILGQKWGIRRYQNEDGTWTAAGKQRYGDDDSDSGKSSKKLSGVSSNDKDSNSKSKSERVKTIAKIGAIAAGTALAAYGTYKISQNYKTQKADWEARMNAIFSSLNDDEDDLLFTPINRTNVNRTNVNKTEVNTIDFKNKTGAVNFKSSNSSSGINLTLNPGMTSSVDEVVKSFGSFEKAASSMTKDTSTSVDAFTKDLLNMNMNDLKNMNLY